MPRHDDARPNGGKPRWGGFGRICAALVLALVISGCALIDRPGRPVSPTEAAGPVTSATAGSAPPAAPAIQQSASRALRLPSASSGERCQLRRAATTPAVADALFLVKCTDRPDGAEASLLRIPDPVERNDVLVARHPWLQAQRRGAACGPIERVALHGSAFRREAAIRLCDVGRPAQPLILGATLVARWVVLFATVPQTAQVVEATIGEMVEPGVLPTFIPPSDVPALRDVVARMPGQSVRLDMSTGLRSLEAEAEIAAAEGDLAGVLASLDEASVLFARAYPQRTDQHASLAIEAAGLLLALHRPNDASARLSRARSHLQATAGQTDPDPAIASRLSLVEARLALSGGRSADVLPLVASARQSHASARQRWRRAGEAAGTDGDAGDPSFLLDLVDVLLAAARPIEAADVLKEAQDLVDTADDVPADLAARRRAAVEARRADLAERLGDRSGAQTAAAAAVASERLGSGPGPVLAERLVRTARLSTAYGDAAAAGAAWTEAMTMLIGAATAESPVQSETVGAYLDLVFSRPSPDLDAAFAAMQLPDEGLIWRVRARAGRKQVADQPALLQRVLLLGRLRLDAQSARGRLVEASGYTGLFASRGRRLAQERLEIAESRVEAIRERLSKDAPLYGALVDPPRWTPDRIAALLRPDEALVLLHATGTRATVIALRSDGRMSGHRRGEVPDSGQGRIDPQSLLDSLFGPVEPLLAGARTVIVVPHGAFFDAPPVLRQHRTVFLPALSTFVALRSRPARPAGERGDRIAIMTLGSDAPAPLPSGSQPAGAGGTAECPRRVADLRFPAPGASGSGFTAMFSTALRQYSGRSVIRVAADGADGRADVAVVTGSPLLPAELRCALEPAISFDGVRARVASALVSQTAPASTIVIPFAGNQPRPVRSGAALAALADAWLLAGAERVLVATEPRSTPALAALLARTASDGMGSFDDPIDGRQPPGPSIPSVRLYGLAGG